MCEVVGEESKSINPLNNLLLSPDAILIIISEIIINKYRYFLSKRTALRRNICESTSCFHHMAALEAKNIEHR